MWAGSSWIGNQPRIQTLGGGPGGGVEALASGRPVWRAREGSAGWGRGTSAGGFWPGSRVGSLEAPVWPAVGRPAECGAASGVLAPPGISPPPPPGVIRLGSRSPPWYWIGVSGWRPPPRHDQTGSRSPPWYWIGVSGWRPWLLFKSSQANQMLGHGWSLAHGFRPA